MADRDAIIAFTDRYLHAEQFVDGLPIGLQVQGRAQVDKIATGVSANLEFFEQAADWGADLLIVHHGMFWDKADRVVRGHLKKRLKVLLDNDLTLVGYHLPLDAHEEVGNNILIARALGVHEPVRFGEYHGQTIGYRGLIEPLTLTEFVEKGKAYFGTEPTVVDGGPSTIHSVAVISGGAWDHVIEAARIGVDCYVTGTADEPVPPLAREEGIHFLAFGHYATERHGVRCLGDVVAEKFDVEVRFFDVDNPL